MKRDFDLVRKILFTIEEAPTGDAPPTLAIEEYSNEQIGYHIYIMCEAGLLEGIETTAYGDTTPIAFAKRMTWSGHEFLDICRDENRWEKSMGYINKMGGVTIDVLKQTLVKISTDQVNNLL